MQLLLYYDDDDYDDDDGVSKSSYFVVILTAIAAGILIIVVAFIALKIITTIGEDEKTEVGKMPNIIGYSYQEVKTYYASMFSVEVESQEYSSEYPAGAIIGQTPAAERDYLVGPATVVKVIVSKGPRMVTIPNVYELDSDTAQTMLANNNGFNVIIKSVFDDVIDKDMVIMTDPPRYDQAEFGSTIYMYVSRGPEEQDIMVPDVIGHTLDEAKTLLNNKFTIQVMKKDSAEDENVVIEQSLPALTEGGQANIVPLNSTIVLTVSTGVAPEKEAVITFMIPDDIDGGSGTFNCYVNGNIVGSEKIDNVAYASSISITVKGTGLQKVMLEAVNDDTKKSETIGEYSIDFDADTVTEVEFKKSAFRKLFSNGSDDEDIEIEDEPIIIDDEIIDYDDEEFWNSILNGY